MRWNCLQHSRYTHRSADAATSQELYSGLLTSLSFCNVFICALYVPLYIHDINNGSDTVIGVVRWKIGAGVFLASLNAELIVSLDRFVYDCYLYRYIN